MTAPTPPNITVTTAPDTGVRVIEIQLPGAPGPRGIQGIPGSSNVLTIGTVTTGAPGSSASATISGISPNQVLNLTIPQGPKGDKGDPNTLTIGTVTTVDALTGGSATITGTAPNQVLNLVMPRGYGVIPAGTTGQVLAKASSTDYDTAWQTPTGTGSLTRQSYVDAQDAATLTSANSHADTGDASTLSSANSHADTGDANTLTSANTHSDTNLNTAKAYTDVAVGKNGSNYQGGATYAFVLADATREVDAGSASASTFTVPPNSSVAFPVGTRLKVVQFGAGQLTIAPGAGVALHRASGFALTARQQFSEIHITKRDTDDWIVSGDLTADSSYVPDMATQTYVNATFLPLAQKGAASGVATLDSGSGLVVPSYEDIVEIAQPANAATGHQRLWMDSTAHRVKSVDSAGSVRTLSSYLGSGTAFPASPQTSDTFLRTDVGTNGTVFHYNGAASVWRTDRVICTSTTRPTATTYVYGGMLIHETDTNNEYYWDAGASVWAGVMRGPNAGDSWFAEYVQTAVQSIPHGTDTNVAFDTARRTAAIVTKAASGNSYTINQAGLYQINAGMRVGTAAASEVYLAAQLGTAQANTTGIITATGRTANAGQQTLSLSAIHQFSVNDTFFIDAWQNSGAAVNTVVGTLSSTGGGYVSLQIVRLR